MRYYAWIPVLFLVSCVPGGAGDSVTTAVGKIAGAAPQIATDWMSGNLPAALIGAGTLIAGLLGWKGGKHVVKRMKDSPPGQIV